MHEVRLAVRTPTPVPGDPSKGKRGRSFDQDVNFLTIPPRNPYSSGSSSLDPTPPPFEHSASRFRPVSGSHVSPPISPTQLPPSPPRFIKGKPDEITVFGSCCSAQSHFSQESDQNTDLSSVDFTKDGGSPRSISSSIDLEEQQSVEALKHVTSAKFKSSKDGKKKSLEALNNAIKFEEERLAKFNKQPKFNEFHIERLDARLKELKCIKKYLNTLDASVRICISGRREKTGITHYSSETHSESYVDTITIFNADGYVLFEQKLASSMEVISYAAIKPDNVFIVDKKPKPTGDKPAAGAGSSANRKGHYRVDNLNSVLKSFQLKVNLRPLLKDGSADDEPFDIGRYVNIIKEIKLIQKPFSGEVFSLIFFDSTGVEQRNYDQFLKSLHHNLLNSPVVVKKLSRAT